MIFLRSLIFIVILALIELWFVPFPLVFLFLFLWQLAGNQEESMFAAFIVGFLFDIVLLWPFGSSSMLLVTMLFVASLYTRKYAADNILFLAAALFIGTLLLEFFYTNSVALWSSLASALIGIFIMKFIFPSKMQYESWYRVSS